MLSTLGCSAQKEESTVPAFQMVDITNSINAAQGGQDGIVWQVLYIDEFNERALIISRDCVAMMPYHDKVRAESITWKKCTLRNWLNDEFYSSLPNEIQARVIEIKNENPDNVSSGTPGGDLTTDKVFLLSIGEADYLFANDSERRASFEGEEAAWWLRSPGNDTDRAAFVLRDGLVLFYGDLVTRTDIGVRPVLWISLT